MSTWDEELPQLVDEDAQRVAVEWAELHGLPSLGDPAGEVERMQSMAAAMLTLHLARRASEDELMISGAVESVVFDAARRAGPEVWESLRPEDFELVPGADVLAALGVPLHS